MKPAFYLGCPVWAHAAWKGNFSTAPGRVNFPRVVEITEPSREPAIIDQWIEGGARAGRKISLLGAGNFDRRKEQQAIGTKTVVLSAVLDGDGLHEVVDGAEFIKFERGETTLAKLERGEPAG
jgi:hypothetical protein